MVGRPPRRIGHYAPDLWAPGGIASYVRRLGAAQSADGREVTFFSRPGGAPPPGLPGPTRWVEDDEALFAEAALGLDVLHLHRPVEALFAGRVPTVRTFHGHQGGCPAGTRFLARSGRPCDREVSVAGCLWGHLAERCGSRRPARVLDHFRRLDLERRQAAVVPTACVSGFVRDRMREAGCADSTLRVIPSPAPVVDGPPTPPPGGPPRFAFLSRLTRKKGGAWLLRAAALVPGVHLDVAGEGPEADALAELAADLGLDDRVTFHGWVGPERAAALLRGARAAVVPSLWHEPAGLVALEAAAHGRAVVASRVGGLPEYARPEAALLVAPGDVAGLAAALRRLADDPDLAGRLGREGARLARTRFAMPRFLAHVDQLYADAVRPGGDGAASPLGEVAFHPASP